MEITKRNKYYYDYYRMTGKIYKSGLKSFIQRHLFHNLQFAFWYRKYQKCPSLLAKWMLYRISREHGLEISPNAQIGEGLYLGHPYNSLANCNVIWRLE